MENFSKRQAYGRLVTALRALSQGAEPSQLNEFSGFGAFKELLFPLDDKSAWSAEELKYTPQVEEIHQLLQKQFGSQYEKALDSIRNSILTSFYTPQNLIAEIVSAVSSPEIKSILEPAAGSGNFIKPLQSKFPDATITAIEKDLTTFQFLKALHPDIETIHNGFENIKPKSYDLVISNVPFGAISVYDDVIYREAIPIKVKSTTRIHNYYFIKGLDNLKEGGKLAYITSSGTMDSPGNKEIREYLVKHADLLSAVRLPNNTFEAAGTSPVTDIIILQKHTGKKTLTDRERQFIQTEKISLEDKGVAYDLDINSYYAKNPSRALGTFAVGGQYRKDSVDLIAIPGATLDLQLREVFAEDFREGPLHGFVVTAPKQNTKPDNIIPDNIEDYQWYRGENLIVFRGQVGKVLGGEEDKRFVTEPAIKDIERTSAFISLRIAQGKLLQAELDGNYNDMEGLRKSLNVEYDTYTFRYGNLYHPSNKKLALFDAEGFKVLSLERLDNGKYVKADIFSRQINNVEKKFSKPESLKDALLISLNATGKADVEFMSELMDVPKADVIREGLDQELIFIQLQNGKPHFVTKDEFLSGNIVAKIATISALGPREIPELSASHRENHLLRLQEVRPVFLKRELIDINLGERWIPDDVYKRFAEHLFKVPCNIQFVKFQDMYMVTLTQQSNENEISWSAQTAEGKMRGFKIFEHAMADTLPNLKIKIPDTDPPKYKADLDGMKNVELKIKEIKDEFENFMNIHKDVAEVIETIYNTKINNTTKRTFDGSHLQFANLKSFDLYAHQKDATWMLVQNDGGIIDHKVGAGKTLVIINAAMEMKRLNIASKPMILAMKANVAQIAKQFKDAYPNARILYPKETDFKPAKRKAIFAAIAANEWDAVILTHDQFISIPQSHEIKKQVLDQELRNVRDDLRAAKGDESLSKRILKGLEVRKSNLTVQIRALDASIQRDAHVLDFEKMGIDHLFVDESQQFKNLKYTTRHSQVAGLGDPMGSNRAFNMEVAIRTIQQKKGGDKGVTFLSGTTISNSLVELYLLFKYQRPNRLNELGINSFDSWAKMYARKSYNFEFTVTNEIKRKERFREFIKVPELAMFYSEITDFVGDATLKIDKPKSENVVINIDPTPSQQEYTERLIRFTKTKDPSHVGLSLSEDELKAFMLIATNLAKKMSLDMRLIDSTAYSYEPESKIGRVAAVIASEYGDSNHYRGTQLVFSDVGTPNAEKFNLYHELKRVLTEIHGLPSEQIQFIHDHDTKKRREALFEKVNAGEVRVLIGSTQKLGTGVNVQRKIIALHHLDIPWRPSDLEQRTGRGERQGNEAAREYRGNVVKNYIYAVNRTLDAYQFNILSNKQKFINQIKNGSIDQRKIDEGSMDQDGSMNFGEYVALLSGNTDLLEKVRIEKRLTDLERGYGLFLKRQSEAEFNISYLKQDIEKSEKFLTRLQGDYKTLQKFDPETTSQTIGGKPVQDRSQVGEWLQKKLADIKGDKAATLQPIELLKLNEFTLYFSKAEFKAYVIGPEKVRYMQADGQVNQHDPALAGRYLIDCIKRIPKNIERTEKEIKENQAKIDTYQKELLHEFREKGEILKLKKEIERLGEKIEKAFKREDPPKGKEKSIELGMVSFSQR